MANIPLIHLLNYKACEERNAEFFSARGMSVWAKSADDAVSAAHTLLLDREKVESMCAAQRKNMNPDAAEAITDCVVNPQ